LKKNISNLSSSVKARLFNKAKEQNKPFLEVLQNFGMERFIYRLSCSKHRDKFILKGALTGGDGVYFILFIDRFFTVEITIA